MFTAENPRTILEDVFRCEYNNRNGVWRMSILGIIGPIMIGPSSSHTAGAVKIGRIARKILGEEPQNAVIGLVGSFAMTYKGHGTDKALIAGILGMKPDDERIISSLELAQEAGLRFEFVKRDVPRVHPNTAIVHLIGKGGAECDIEGVSIGGGNVRITKLDGLDAVFSGSRDTLIIAHHNRPGVAAAVTGMLAHFGVNIESMRLTRTRKDELTAMIIEIDTNMKKSTIEVLRELKDIVSVVYMKPE